tara:strand:- start:41449 stop:43038 length:1590 start_codon:yes stop_codon:yes gene_type:complete
MRNFQLPGRSPVFGCHGAVATSHPLATQVAADILKSGGNAIDAAVASAATLSVVEPQSTGIGGDCFALCAINGKVPPVAINGSGYAPAAAKPEWFSENNITNIDSDSPHAVTVPGAVRTWEKLISDYGTRSLGELLKPAINYARDGYVVSPRVSVDWKNNQEKLSGCDNASRIFLKEGAPPDAGTIHKQPELADTLELISREGADILYEGCLAEELVTYLRSLGSLMTVDDFSSFTPKYVNPIYTNYRGYDVYECPPNGQGVIALLMLKILSGYDAKELDPLGVDRFHLEAEIAKLAYRDRSIFLADPDKVEVPLEYLLSDSHAEELRSKISMRKAISNLSITDKFNHRDTVYLATVDSRGNFVSFINSLFHPFGSGLCSPKSGIIFQNRGSSFSLDKNHMNCIAGHKRPMHTIIPGILSKNNSAIMAFGVMGGHYQACGHMHILSNLIDYDMDIQEALDFPRGFSFEDSYDLESTIPHSVASGLQDRGHKINWVEEGIGGGQIVSMDLASGVISGASEPRKDGVALAW